MVHPAAKLFPMMGPDELKELADDITERGLIQPIVRYNGAILDGRNRFVACGMAGVKPQFVEWTENGSPTAWVPSVNLHRRHLSQSQKAAIGFDALSIFETEAKERQKLSDGRGKKGKEIIPDLNSDKGQARDKAAAAVGVNPRYISDVKAIAAKSPEAVEKIRSGEMSIPEAKKIIRGPTAPQPPSAQSCRSSQVQSKTKRQKARE